MIAAILDHLWQSTLFAACAGLLTLTLRNNAARIRYWLWFAASAKFLLPFSILTVVGSHWIARFAPVADVPLAVYPAAHAVQQAAEPFSAATPILTAPASSGSSLIPILLMLWVIGFAAVSLVWVLRWSRIRAALNSAVTLPVIAPIAVKSTSSFLEPGLVGIWRPVLLIPEGIAAQLSADEMHAILVHELCHLRRRDNLTAAIHMLVEALFWFHPLVWWLGARLIDERERACDEDVLGSGSDPQVYAEGILKVCRFYVHLPLVCSAGVSGADLKRRVETIMTNRAAVRVNAPKRYLLAAAAAIALAVPLLAGVIPLLPANAQSSDGPEPHKLVAVSPALLDSYAGYYEFDASTPAGGVVMALTRNGDHLSVKASGQPQLDIYPQGSNDFFYTVVPANITFETVEGGRATGLVIHQNGLNLHATQVSADEAARADAAFDKKFADQQRPRVPVAVDPKLFDGYVGLYRFTPKAALTVTRDGDRLFAQMTGQSKFEVYPSGPKDFFYTVTAAQITFVTDASGHVTQLILHQMGRDIPASRSD